MLIFLTYLKLKKAQRFTYIPSKSKYTEFIYSTNASAAIVAEDFEPTEKINTTLIKVKDPYSSFTTILELLIKK